MRAFVFISVVALVQSAALRSILSSLEIADNSINGRQISQDAKDFIVDPPQDHRRGSSYTRERRYVEETRMYSLCTFIESGS